MTSVSRKLVLPRKRVVLRSRPRPPPTPSTVALGTAFERATAHFLAHAPVYRLQGVVRVGGAGDQGVDLRARWPCPPTSSPLVEPAASAPSPTHDPTQGIGYPAIVQCKAESSRVGPATVRELEGTLVSQSPHHPTIGILVALSGFTEAALRHARASPRPLALLHLEMAQGGSHDLVRQSAAGSVPALRLVSASNNRVLGQLLQKIG